MYLKENLTLEEVEKQYILNALERNSWNYKRVSKMLGISRSTLWRRLKEYGIDLTGTWKERNGK